MITGRKYLDRLYTALKLHPQRDIISFVGAGGKTSAILRLSKELQYAGRRVIITATSPMEKENAEEYGLIRLSGELTPDLTATLNRALANGPAFVAKRLVRGGKIKGITVKQTAEINREVSFEYMLIKADSAEKKLLKAHHRREPPVPKCTTLFVAVIGYQIIGRKLNISNVHRPQLAARILKKPLESVIRPEDIIAILKHPQGLLKGRPPATRTAVLLNGVCDNMQDEAKELAYGILKSGAGINSIICGRVNTPQQLLLFS